MILSINANESIAFELSLRTKEGEVKSCIVFSADGKKDILLLLVRKLLDKEMSLIKDITYIQVENSGHGFTTTRLRVAIANALAYALNIPVKPITGKALKKKGIMIVPPLYSQAPNITTKK
jgi:tRNA A37 threonylcarbamoyladenosine modification protein TsaB